MSQPFNPFEAALNGSNGGGVPNGSPSNGAAFNAPGAHPAGANGSVPLPGAGAGGFDGRAAFPSGASGRELERFGFAPVPAYPKAPRLGEDDDETVDLSRYWRALKRRRSVVLRTLGVTLGLGLLWTLLQKPVYQSSPATIMVSTPGGGGGRGGGNDLFRAITGGAAPSSSLGQQMVIMRSPNVQLGALKRLDGATQQKLAAFAAPDIAPDPTSDTINVSVQARDAQAGAALAEAICQEYISQNDKQNNDQVNDATRQVKAQRDAAGRELKRIGDELLRFQKQQKTVDINAETTALLGQINDIESAIRTNDTSRLSNEAQLRGVQDQLRHLPDYTPTSIVTSPEVQAIKQKLTELSIDRNQQAREYTPTSRVIRDLDAQIRGLQAQLKAAAQTQVGGLSPNPLRQSLLQKQADLQGQIWASEASERALQSSLTQAQAQREQLPLRANNLNALKLDQGLALTALQGWDDQYRKLSAQARGGNSNARVIIHAAPGPMIAPRRTFNIVASAFLGLMLGAALALLLDRLDNRVHDAQEAGDAAHLPVLAYVPLVERGGAALLVSGAGGASQNPALVESFRMLRANIAFAGLDEPPRVVAVTSSRAGEGKSTSALNLATVVALAGKSVLLVDCDLRRPEVHALLGLPNEVGLTSVAAGMASLESAVQNTRVPGLRVLTSGPIPPNAPELFESRGGRAALLAASGQADFVVMDCPPSLGLADAHLVSGLADATLLVVACESTNKREVARAARSLSQAGGRLLGIVLNKMPLSRGDNQDYFQLPAFHNGAAGLVTSSPPVAAPARPVATGSEVAAPAAGVSSAANGSGTSSGSGSVSAPGQ